jgi:hypothetical protein
MSLERFYQLRSEFDENTQRFAHPLNPGNREIIIHDRKAIIAEAREIAERLNLPEPNWLRYCKVGV